MAVSFVNLDSINTGVANPSVSNSKTFTSGRLYMIAATSRKATPPAVTSVAFTGGAGGTWARAAASSALGNNLTEIWWVIATSNVTDTVTVTWAGAPNNASLIIDEGTGHDAAGTVVQAVGISSNSNLTSLAVTLAAFGDAVNNAVYSAHSHGAQEATTVDAAPAGYVALANVQSLGSGAVSIQTQWNVGEDLSVSQSWTTASKPSAVAVEIKAAGGNVTVTTPGAITFTGQAVGLVTTIAPTAGAIVWSGATGITLSVALIVSVTTPGALTLAGQALGLKTLLGLSPGAIVFAGQAVTAGAPVAAWAEIGSQASSADLAMQDTPTREVGSSTSSSEV